MPNLLHDPIVGNAIRSRVNALTPSSTRACGKMTPDQMLRHCSVTLEAAMGCTSHSPMSVPMPRSILKFLVLNMPWPQGAQTHPDWVADDRDDFQTEKTRCLSLIDEFTATPLDAKVWAPPPGFGKMSGRDHSRLQAKHLDHHLRQFSV
ncbi:MAG TPA: DinB family protein [Gemmatimonadaceae bacterium]